VFPERSREMLAQFGRDIRQWAGQTPTERSLANVEFGGRPSRWARFKAPFTRDPFSFRGDDWLTKLQSAAQDALAPVMRGIQAARRLRGMGDPKPEHDPEMLIRLVGGQVSKFTDMLDNGLADARNERVLDPQTQKPMNVAWLVGAFDQSKRAVFDRQRRDAIALMIAERVVEKGGRLMADADAQAAALEAPYIQAGQPIPQRVADRAAAIRAAAQQRAGRLAGTGAGVESDYALSEAVIRELQGDPARYRVAQEGARRYRLWAERNLDYLVSKGWLAPDRAAEIKASNQFYADFHRIIETVDGEIAPGGGGDLGSMTEVLHAFKGSTRKLIDPYINLLTATERIYGEADRNAAMREFRDLLVADRGMYEGAPVDLAAIGSR
jgi:hypothetical protein